jgi:hypothetical protein
MNEARKAFGFIGWLEAGDGHQDHPIAFLISRTPSEAVNGRKHQLSATTTL